MELSSCAREAAVKIDVLAVARDNPNVEMVNVPSAASRGRTRSYAPSAAKLPTTSDGSGGAPSLRLPYPVRR